MTSSARQAGVDSQDKVAASSPRRYLATLRLAIGLLSAGQNLKAAWLIALRTLLGATDLILAAALYVLFLLLQGSAAPRGRWFLPQTLLSASMLSITLVVARVSIEIWVTGEVVRFTQQIYAEFMLRLTAGYMGLRWSRFVGLNRSTLTRHAINTSLDAAFSYQLYIETVSGCLITVLITAAIIYQSRIVAAVFALLTVGMYLAHRFLLQNAINAAAAEREQALRPIQVTVGESLSLAREVRAYNNQHFFTDRLGGHAQRLAATNVKLAALPQVARILSENAPVLILLAILTVVELRHGSSQALLSLLVFYFVLSRRLFPLLSQLAMTVGQLAGANENLQTIDAELRACKLHSIQPRVLALPREGYALEVEDLHASFPGRPKVLDGITLAVRAGQTTILSGPSGCGKSSLLNILAGVAEPDAGQVRIDPSSVAYVPQDTLLLDATIRTNLLFGLQQDDPAIWHCLQIVNLEAFVAAMPNGLDTRVGDNGILLSGGQRQRLGLARALLRNPRLLLLDEATSALDLPNEELILTRLSALGLAIVMVTHRRPPEHLRADTYSMEAGRLVPAQRPQPAPSPR